MDMKPQTVEMQEWLADVAVERASYYGLKAAALIAGSWVVVGVILWLAGVL